MDNYFVSFVGITGQLKVRHFFINMFMSVVTNFCYVEKSILFVFTSYQHVWSVAFFPKVI